MSHRPLFPKIPWMQIEHIVAMKLGLSVALLAAYVVPHPWSIVVGAAANMVWVWKL
ncbi:MULTISPECIES: hypothetical protein [Pseudomonas]|jgi:hypothetical protein|uniref:hypothetical protein n=1 Tax=Pseudomonas TaxID=286 RepID=UPI0015AD0AC0|nr:hypothetical protein [Pseudomonas sp. Sample_16]